MPNLSDLLTRSEEASRQLAEANSALLALARSLAVQSEADRGDPAMWRRMPPKGRRCTVSQLSRSYLYKLGRDGRIRLKRLGGVTYYSAGDVLNLISEA